MPEPIPLARPDIAAEDIAAVQRVVASGRLSLGPETEGFEDAVAQLCEAAGAVAVSSGTAGLQLALEACGIGPGDEVITSAFTFVATANAIRQVGATVVLVDIDPLSMNLDAAQVAAAITDQTRAIVPVHVFGRLADMTSLMRLARRHDLRVIEDACEALGSRRGALAAGGIGDAGVFGFYPNKVITCGEGGMIVSSDRRLLETCRRLRNHGRGAAGQPAGHGHNFRMTEMQAALGRSQIARLAPLIDARRRVASAYRQRLGRIAGLRLPVGEAEDESVSWFGYVPRLNPAAPPSAAAAIRRAMGRRGIETGHYFPALHRLDHLAASPFCRHGPLPRTEDAADRGLALPIYPGLDETALDTVAGALADCLAASTGGV
jgi:perosamine synthetase